MSARPVLDRLTPMLLAAFLLAGLGRPVSARPNKSENQAAAAARDNHAAPSSTAGGRTYDGSAAADADTSVVRIRALRLTHESTSRPAQTLPPLAQSVPEPKSKDAAPWQKDIDLATALIAGATLLLLLAAAVGKMPPNGPIAAKTIGWAVTAMGVAVIALGSKIVNEYGQKMQGSILAGIGALLVVAGQMAAWSDYGQPAAQTASPPPSPAAAPPSPDLQLMGAEPTPDLQLMGVDPAPPDLQLMGVDPAPADLQLMGVEPASSDLQLMGVEPAPDLPLMK